jgi:hypothetical protein
VAYLSHLAETWALGPTIADPMGLRSIPAAQQGVMYVYR